MHMLTTKGIGNEKDKEEDKEENDRVRGYEEDNDRPRRWSPLPYSWWYLDFDYKSGWLSRVVTDKFCY